MPSQSFTHVFIQELIASLESARTGKMFAEAECKRLRAGFLRILEASDSEMADGDFARQCAERALYPNEPDKWLYGKDQP